jgi:hypothetical protein
MTYDDAANLIYLIVEIAKAEVEREALDPAHWQQADYLRNLNHIRRNKAIALLTGEEE